MSSFAPPWAPPAPAPSTTCRSSARSARRSRCFTGVNWPYIVLNWVDVAPCGRGLRRLSVRLSWAAQVDEGDRVRGLHRIQPQQVAHGALRLHGYVVSVPYLEYSWRIDSYSKHSKLSLCNRSVKKKLICEYFNATCIDEANVTGSLDIPFECQNLGQKMCLASKYRITYFIAMVDTFRVGDNFLGNLISKIW